jgi:predicted nucleotidyltransferase component of viral defense system
LSPRDAVEFFHLVFTRGLAARLEDKTLVALKGGVNLRFFFHSVRYSEDIDFDVAVIAKNTLTKKVDELLRAPLVVAPLAAKGLAIVDSSKPKQSETTQRWKAGVRVDKTGEVIRTRVEFSRRDAIAGAKFEAIPSSVASAHGVPPFLVMHYERPRAILHKIRALHDRREPQPRDIFDLNLLFAQEPSPLHFSSEGKAMVRGAIERAMSVSFADYSAKVAPYLEPDHFELFASRESWDLMQTVVVERLEEMLS